MYDLIVIGGGPAGTAAAIISARHGARVLVLERGEYPRHKVCGEFVSAESLGVLSSLLGAESSLLHDVVRVSAARIFLDGRMLSAKVEPAAASITRLELDEALWQAALKSGVDAREQIAVQGVEKTSSFHVKTTAGEFEARAVINATGRWSKLNEAQAALGKKWLGVKAHFAEDDPSPTVDLYFFDGGYCGVQPVGDKRIGGTINVCAMVRAERAKKLDDVFALHPALKERSRTWRKMMEPVSTFPLIFRQPDPVRDGMLLVGDAAGFVDPFVGDGISLALRGGVLAAESLQSFFEGKKTLEQAQVDYGDAYERRLAPVFRVSSVLRRLLTWPRSARVPVLTLMQSMPGIARYVVEKTR